jgi:acyl transferase domain-containing protein/NADPH:quinone reductase-like Zn-dependent oxidoreductase/NAD(P)-dependent dehydrogenase (short-subunit alcohol dehydrogenase family)/acyl carrier protein
MKQFDDKKVNTIKKATDKIIELKRELSQLKKMNHSEPLAIVGMGCTFPGGANSPEHFWQKLLDGYDGICQVPKDRWDADAYFSKDTTVPGKINTKKGGFIDIDVANFDAFFFGISPKEASSMDPQQRLLLEVTWQALENAAINPQTLKDTDGSVYIGSCLNDYQLVLNKPGQEKNVDAYMATGNSSSVMAGRIAYILGLQGPALSCDTACSSSLVAIHLACNALRNRETNLAIVGGVNLILAPNNSIVFSKANMLCEDGHCKTFDEKADGYVRGEGCGVVIIKRLSDALSCHDTILGVIKGSAMNQDGASGGLTVPSIDAQAKVIKLALNDARLAPKDIDLIETHGTGTALGDPIEIQSISHVFKNRDNDLILGSAKVNIGHLEGAAGIAGLIKTILSLHHQRIPKHRNFHKLNPMISLDEIKGFIPLETKTWARSETRVRRAGISSFGFSGTNVHVIVEEAPDIRLLKHERRPRNLFCFSAKSEEALQHYLQKFIIFLTDETISRLNSESLSYTLNTGRAQFKYRIAFFAPSLKNLKEKMVIHDSIERESLQNKDVDEMLAESFLMGEQTEFTLLYSHPLEKIQLPNYAFQHKRYWEKSPKKIATHIESLEFFDMHWQEVESMATQSLESKHMIVCENNLSILPKIDKKTWATVDGVVLIANKKQTDWDALLSCVKQLIAIKHVLPLGLNIITQGALPIPNRQTQHKTSESNAMLVGLIKSLNWEAPFLHAKLIDIDNITVLKSLRKNLPVTSGHLLGLAQKKWYQPEIKNITSHALAKEKPFNPEGTHWITGGTGSLGLALASELIKLGVTSLILSSRKGDSSSAQNALKQHLHQNLTLRVVSVDITNKAALKKLILAEIPSNQPLKAIYHLAGMNVQKPMLDLDWPEVEKTMSAKVLGVKHLHALTHDMDLNYFVLFSSIASFAGSNRQLPYVIANSYLDSLATQRRENNQASLLINWGPWAQSTMIQQTLDDVGLIPVATGLACFTQLIQAKLSAAAVINPEFIPFMFSFYPYPQATWLGDFLTFFEQNKIQPQKTALVEKLLSLSKDARQKQLVVLVSEAVQEALALEHSPPKTEGFFDLGMDSLMSVDMGKKIQQRLGIELKPTAAFDYPNIEAMADYLEALLTSDVDVTKHRVISCSEKSHDSIAIIGMSCHFPGDAVDLDAFWDCLYNGKDCISDVPTSRFELEAYLNDEQLDVKPQLSKQGGFIQDIDLFDAEFFNISPREAKSLDPQQRLILENSWKALEHAGINPKSLKGKQVGIFVGISQSEYASFVLKHEKTKSAYHATGNALNAAAGRLAYMLGTQGPAMAIDTACSSSLVALHEACNSLKQGDCDMAIVAGVNAIIDPEVFITLANAEMLSPDGACKTFDERANGYVRGEGCGVIVLQRAESLQFEDSILALIRASHVNQDGASSGLTVPNGVAQKELIHHVLSKANLKPDDIDYIETHGSGTSLGDPIEVGALNDVFLGRKKPLLIGTVKTNIGHLESASGIAGIIKTVLSLNHQYIPKHLHFSKLNPHIDLSAIPAIIPTEGMAFPKVPEKRRRAGVSSFGFSGTNVHVVLEEAPPVLYQNPKKALPTEHLFVLSAQSNTSLKSLIARYTIYLKQTNESLANICFTAAIGRSHFPYRIALKTSSVRELEAELSDIESITPSHLEEVSVVEESNIESLIDAYRAGHIIDWNFFYKPLRGLVKKVVLPTYVFDKKHHWIDIHSEEPCSSSHRHPLLRNQAYSHHHKEYLFTTQLSLRYPSFVQDHTIYDLAVIAGATYVSMMVSFVLQVLEERTGVIQELMFNQPLIVDKKNPRMLQMVVQEKDTYTSTFEILSYQDKMPNSCISHAEGAIQISDWCSTASTISIDDLKQQLHHQYDGRNHQHNAMKSHLHLGPHFHWIDTIHYNETELLALMRLPTSREKTGYDLYPGFIDASFQTIVVWLDFDPGKTTLRIPVSIEKISFKDVSRPPQYVHMKRTQGTRHINISYLDAGGTEVLAIETFVAKEVTKATLLKMLDLQYEHHTPTYFIDWQRASERAFPEMQAPKREMTLCIINPSSAPLSNLEQALSPFVVSVKNKVTANLDAEHVLYVYPITSQLGQHDDIYVLHQHVQELLNHQTVKSIGMIMNDSLAHSPIMGYWKTLGRECQEKNIYLIESNIANHERMLSHVIHVHCLGQTEEFHVAIRHATYYVPRLLNHTAFEAKKPFLPHPTQHQILTCKNQLLDTLAWQDIPSAKLDDNQVRIQIKMTSLNFRDVLKLMGTYPGRSDWHSFEHAGVVTEIGRLVRDVHVGDNVFTLAESTFGSESRVDASKVYKIPSHLSLKHACSIPGVFLTAYGCLYAFANIQKDDKILIHAASGGVGLAAIQLAKLRGATLFVTTSTPKQAYLKSLGIHYIYDSRTSGFGEKILDDTQGTGVSLVLNSLTSDGFIDESLGALQQGGTFIEIGKINIYSQEKMAATRPDVNYHIYALDEQIVLEWKKTTEQLDTILKLHEQGQCHPLKHKVFDVRQTVEAFRYLQSGRHIGKVLIKHSEPFSYHSDKTYLITGGLGGLGLQLIHHLMQKGVKHITIIGRRKIASLTRYLGNIMTDEVKLDYHPVDVCDERAVVALIAKLNASPQKLAGIFHLAGLLNDRTIMNLTPDDFDNSFKTKVLGSMALHHASQDLDLDCFVMFSSIASVFGSPGQANYASANAFMDKLAHQRIESGLSALSINWGPFAEAGMAKEHIKQYQQKGLNPLDWITSFNTMDNLLERPFCQGIIADFNWQKVSTFTQSKTLCSLVHESHQDNKIQLVDILQETPLEKREDVLSSELRKIAASVLYIEDENEIDEHKGFFDLGLDSLMSVEMWNRLQSMLGEEQQLSKTILFEKNNIYKLRHYLQNELFPALFETQKADKDLLKNLEALLED